MIFIRGLKNIPINMKDCVATIGNFDGVHVGHQALLHQLKQEAIKRHLPSVVILFEPQPQEYFLSTRAKSRLTNLQEKILLLKQFEVDAILCLPFNKTLSQLDAEQFMKIVLKQKLNVGFLLIGDDFRFGRDRQGSFQMLKNFGMNNDMTVTSLETVQFQGLRVSSTLIRQALADANFELVQSLLGRPFYIYGKVIHGDKRGRTIGFKTANITLKRLVSPLYGVYAIQVEGIDDVILNGIANIGFRPTVDGQRLLLEVHIFDFEKEIYDQKIKVVFLKKIRDEKRFHSLEALQAQIEEDVLKTKKFFHENF